MKSSEIILNAFFYAMAAAAVAGAVGVAASRNIVRSAFALLAVLFSAAAMYAVMKADFIAAAQVLIYVGGILVLIIFAVMLTHRITDVRISNESTPGPAAFFACLCLLASLVLVILNYEGWKRDAEPAAARAGDAELTLYQYQADGRTGIARGVGTALEDRVVLGVRPAKAAPGARVEVQAAPAPDKDKPADWSRAVAGSAEVGPDGTARIELSALPVGFHQWRARLAGSAAWTRGDAEKGVDFAVEKGVTKPAARALMGPYLLAFEAISVLLLAALVGAAYLARKEVKG